MITHIAVILTDLSNIVQGYQNPINDVALTFDHFLDFEEAAIGMPPDGKLRVVLVIGNVISLGHRLPL